MYNNLLQWKWKALKNYLTGRDFKVKGGGEERGRGGGQECWEKGEKLPDHLLSPSLQIQWLFCPLNLNIIGIDPQCLLP